MMLLWIATLAFTMALGFSIAFAFERRLLYAALFSFPLGLLISSWLFFGLLFYMGFAYAYVIFAAVSIFLVAYVSRGGGLNKILPGIRSMLEKLGGLIVGFFSMREISGNKNEFYRKLVAYSIIAFVFAFVVIYFLFSVRFDAAGNVMAYGGAVTDLPWHLGIANHFAYSTPATVMNFPYFEGTKFFYPFMADYYLSVLIRSGMNSVSSAIVANVILAAVIVALLYFLVYRLSKDRLVAASAAFIFLLFSSQVFNFLPGTLGAICSLNQATFPFGAGIIEMVLSPQRDMLTALALVLAALLILTRTDFSKKHAAVLGIIVGLMPLLQGEMFIALNVLMLYMLIKRKFVEYGIFFVIMIALSAPQLLFIASQESVHSFLYPIINNGQFYCGYGPAHAAAPAVSVVYGLANRLAFWFKSYGFMLPFSVYGLYVLVAHRNDESKGRAPNRRGGKRAARHYSTERILLLLGVPFLLLFITLNTFSLQPSFADNNKVSLVFAIYLAILAAYPLKYARGKRFLLVIVVLALIGGQNVYFLYNQMAGSFGYHNPAAYRSGSMLFSHEDFEIAAQILNSTSPNSVIISMPSWLGSPEASGISLRNPVAALTGRQMVTAMGTYVGGIGIPFNNLVSRSNDELSVYKNWGCGIIREYNVSYIYVGYYEMNLTNTTSPFPVAFNLNYAGENFTLYNTTGC